MSGPRASRGVEDCNLYWFEEPISPDNKRGSAEVRATTRGLGHDEEEARLQAPWEGSRRLSHLLGGSRVVARWPAGRGELDRDGDPHLRPENGQGHRHDAGRAGSTSNEGATFRDKCSHRTSIMAPFM